MDNVTSIIISVVATFVVTWYFARKQMKNNEITHYSINSFDVGKGLRTDFPQFQINYEGKEINNEVHVLKGGFVNTGRDISDLKGKTELSITLPKSCRLKDIKVQESNTEFQVKASSDEKEPNVIKFGIFEQLMHDEGFNYTAIVETGEVINNLRHEVKYNKRIPRTDLKKEYIGQGKQPKRLLFLAILSGLSSLLFIFLSFVLLFQQQVKFTVREKNTNKEVILYEDFNSQLYVSDNKNAIMSFFSRKSVERDDINNNYTISPTVKKSFANQGIISVILLAILFILYAYISYESISKYFRRKHVISILKLNSKGSES